jgi:hypothetical protein
MAPVVWISPSPCRLDAPLPRFRPVSMVPKSPLCHALYRQPIVPVLPLHASILVRAQMSYFWTCCQCFHHIACLHSTPTFALNRLASHTPVSPSSHRSRTKREDPTLGHDRFNLECAVRSRRVEYLAHRSRARAGAAKRPSRLPTWLRHPTQWMQRAQGHRSRPHLCFLHHFALAFCWEGQGTRPARLLRPHEQRMATLLLFVHTLAALTLALSAHVRRQHQ